MEITLQLPIPTALKKILRQNRRHNSGDNSPSTNDNDFLCLFESHSTINYFLIDSDWIIGEVEDMIPFRTRGKNEKFIRYTFPIVEYDVSSNLIRLFYGCDSS